MRESDYSSIPVHIASYLIVHAPTNSTSEPAGISPMLNDNGAYLINSNFQKIKLGGGNTNLCKSCAFKGHLFYHVKI